MPEITQQQAIRIAEDMYHKGRNECHKLGKRLTVLEADTLWLGCTKLMESLVENKLNNYK